MKLDNSGRVLLPKKLREALNLKPGDKIQAYLEDDHLIMVPESKTATASIENSFPVVHLPDGVNFTSDFLSEARAAREREILGESHE